MIGELPDEELGTLVSRVLRRDRVCVFCGSDNVILFKHTEGPATANTVVLGCKACISVINEYRRISR